MPSLRELRALHAPLLLIDAASATVQVGALAAQAREDRWQTSADEAGIGIFASTGALPLAPNDYRAFVFCDGPGSILGIRSAAAALRAWQVIHPRPVFRYHSLALVARAQAQPGLQLIADARRNTWHRCTVDGGLERVPPEQLGEQLAMPAGFRHWSPLPAGVRSVPYDLPALLATTEEADLFTPTDAPDAFLHEEPSYATWTPQIHRAP